MGTFGDPILGGDGEELIREAIRSRDYSAGVSGWRIAANGAAEFASVTATTGPLELVGDTVTIIATGVNPFPSSQRLVTIDADRVNVGGRLVPDWLDVSGTFTIDGRDTGRGTIGAGYRDPAGTIASASPGGAEVLVPWGAAPDETYTFRTGRVYRWWLRCGVWAAGASLNQMEIRLRKGAASTAGVELGYTKATIPAGVGPGVMSWYAWGDIKNETGADITTKLSLTIKHKAGPDVVEIYDDASIALVLDVEDKGNSQQMVNLAASANAIT